MPLQRHALIEACGGRLAIEPGLPRGPVITIDEVGLVEDGVPAGGATLAVVSIESLQIALEGIIEPVRRPAGRGVVTPIVPEEENAVSTVLVSLGGTVRVDQVWTLRLTVDDDTTEYVYTAAAGDDLNDIAEALAAKVAADGVDGIAVAVEGTVLIVSDRFARNLSAVATLTLPVFFSTDETTATTTLVRMSGMPGPGEKWSITLDDLAFTVMVGGDVDTLGRSRRRVGGGRRGPAG